MGKAEILKTRYRHSVNAESGGLFVALAINFAIVSGLTRLPLYPPAFGIDDARCGLP
ncbi:hypothetical protein RGR602_PB00328 (plasmid) [Rhizobium gallicum bv. gallicum R602sp]|uniref:Uncharacterized protein n=1 Tax=Rhizobium gallicum bv. gallicum R602sp TaxID=1041138 RepID=A0A0B4XBE3_9HYPH|nr:hypothetical protein RGR602_PB00328 [Rhizobium gallicum bv. gallicum R602sp]